jgi:hypothetical protein
VTSISAIGAFLSSPKKNGGYPSPASFMLVRKTVIIRSVVRVMSEAEDVRVVVVVVVTRLQRKLSTAGAAEPCTDRDACWGPEPLH